VRRELQPEVRPLIISHAANRLRPGRSRFLAEFDWQGTFDPSALLAVPAAIAFLESLRPGGLDEHYRKNRALALMARQLLVEAIGSMVPAPDSMIGSMATIPLPPGPPPEPGRIDPLQQRLIDRHLIEVPVFCWPDTRSRWLRISAQAYNHLGQYHHLAEALVDEQATF
jgi:isopenicillin-N epimerase